MNISRLEQSVIDIIKLHPKATGALIKETVDGILERLLVKGIISYHNGVFSIRDPRFMTGVLLDEDSAPWIQEIMRREFGEKWLHDLKEGVNIGSEHIFVLRLESPRRYVIIDVTRKEKKDER